MTDTATNTASEDASSQSGEETKTPKVASKKGLGLSAQLLILTITVIMLAEVLIYVPSISRYRKTFLEEHIARAHVAALSLTDMPQGMANKKLEAQLLLHAEAHGIILHLPKRRVMVMRGSMPPKVDIMVDLRKGNFFMWIADAFDTLVQNDNRVMRVIGPSPKMPWVNVEVIMDETPMRLEMYGYSARILQLSILISVIAALMVYFSLRWLMIRPIQRITTSMTAFRDDPEDESRTIEASDRRDELGIAETELGVMQQEVRAALRQKTRLATLGAAVAKINHDLRNTLSTAVLVSDSLANIDDPEVKRVMPRLFTAIDRAVHLCSDTLNYVADGIPKLQRENFPLASLVDEVGLLLSNPNSPAANGMGGDETDIQDHFEWRNEVGDTVEIEADRRQLFRAIQNLGHNARLAGAGWVRVYAYSSPEKISIEIADNGPGLPEQAKERLFQPFAGSVRKGGTGLGLVIVRDILRAHGGDVALVRSDKNGTMFSLNFPKKQKA